MPPDGAPHHPHGQPQRGINGGDTDRIWAGGQENGQTTGSIPSRPSRMTGRLRGRPSRHAANHRTPNTARLMTSR